ncbi:MAG: hypothetical protein FWH33_10595 [Oscillospiraceae bacterium]|nr:hypothetical protein [Oscillospiraceae bacterium]
MQGNVISYATYDDWGAPTSKAVLKTGLRELDVASQYTVHPYDQVLGLYFAQARMYDAAGRRFLAMDPLSKAITNTMPLAAYAYVNDNPIRFIDPLGLFLSGTTLIEGAQGDDIYALNMFLYANGFIDDYYRQYMIDYLGLHSYNSLGLLCMSSVMCLAYSMHTKAHH